MNRFSTQQNGMTNSFFFSWRLSHFGKELFICSYLSSHSTSASVSELSRLVTHTAVSSPKCNSENRPLSNSVAFRTLFKWHQYCGILKIHIIRKINTGIRYEPVYHPALLYIFRKYLRVYIYIHIIYIINKYIYNINITIFSELYACILCFYNIYI